MNLPHRLGRWLSSLRGAPASAKPPEADVGAAHALVDFLGSQLPPLAADDLLSQELASWRKLPAERARALLPRMYLRLEQRLTEYDPSRRYERDALRAQIAARFPELLEIPRLQLVLRPDQEQEETLLHDFLRMVLQRSVSAFGEQPYLLEFSAWLSRPAAERGAPPPPPAASQGPLPASDMDALSAASRNLYAHMAARAGRDQAIQLFQKVWEDMSACCIELDAFQIMTARLPDDMLTPVQVAMFSRQQGQRLLLDKIAQFELVNRKLVHEISERRLAERALQESESRLEALIANAMDAVVTTDMRGMITSWNQEAEHIFGWPARDAVGRRLSELIIAEPFRAEHERSLAMFAQNIPLQAWRSRTEIQAQHRSGHEFPVELSIVGLHLDNELMFCGFLRDLSERHLSQARIEYLAHHDTLTGLPNRILLCERFDQAAALAQKADKKIAMLFLDLDRFKTINDSLGHSTGDALLNGVAERLRALVRGGDIISRLGGDEFVVMLGELEGDGDIAVVGEKILHALSAPFKVDGHHLQVGASIGISLFPDDGSDFDTLLRKADIAMYHAKDSGRNTFSLFNEEMNSSLLERIELERELRNALPAGELEVHFQPRVDLRSGQATGAEALLRWNNSKLGVVEPSRFIPVAEDCGLIRKIGLWVLENACREALDWPQDKIVSVNVSGIQMHHERLLTDVRKVLATTGLPAERLELELTESVLLSDIPLTESVLSELSALGIKLAIDDFGTGYSSLSYLKRFTVHRIKIDRSFVRDMTMDENDALLVRTMVVLAEQFGLGTTAEGVENAAQLEMLRNYRCDEGQGFLFGSALTAADMRNYFTHSFELPPNPAGLEAVAMPERRLSRSGT